jgi:hypothetical protein
MYTTIRYPQSMDNEKLKGNVVIRDVIRCP